MFSKVQKMKKDKKGFTLIELIVVIAIIGILAAVLIPRFTGFTDKANATQALVSAKQVATAYDSWFAENGNSWPAAADVDADTDAIPIEIEDLSGVPVENFTLEADGGVIVDQNGYRASRADGDSKVVSVGVTP